MMPFLFLVEGDLTISKGSHGMEEEKNKGLSDPD